MLRIGPLSLESRVVQSPMAACTDLAFRLVARGMGLGLAFAEMVSDRSLLRRNPKTLLLLKTRPGDRPLGAQLVGSDPGLMAEAAAALEEMGFDLVDLNLGCPAPKITRAGAGAALLAHPRKAQALFERVARALRRIPATVKTRIGLKDPSGLEASEIARLAEGSGIAAVAVHGRTREARYSGPADLGAIARVKAAVRIPVLGNGGVFTPEDAAAMREATGCDGVMVGRGGLGNPWLYRAAEAALEGRPQGPGPEPGSRREAALRHLALELEIEGERAAALNMRRAACWYFAGLPGAAAFRAEICRAATTARQRELIEKFQLP